MVDMTIPPLEIIAAFGGLLGPVSHYTWFIHGEHDFYARTYVVSWFLFQAVGFALLNRLASLPFSAAALYMSTVSGSFLITLFASISIYRLFFHRLHRFPGPLTWKWTKLAQFVKNGDAKGYLHLDALHRKYGPIVRTGPNELSIIDPAATSAILGPGTKCRKAIWYDVGLPLVSMHQCRDKKLHDVRRRAWDKGFGAKALRDYEGRISQYSDLLMRQLRAFGGKALNASKWFNYYSFDVMGDLAFGESFNMLETGEKHFAIPMLEAGMAPMNIIPVVPWFFWLLTAVPALTKEYDAFIAWSGEQVRKRKGMKLDKPDVMTHILSSAPMSTDEKVNQNWEKGDGRLIIVAGSDTTAATLTYCAYEIIKHPEAHEKLRKEVSQYVTADGHVDHQGLQNCSYVNAVIDETLRLHPPVPSGLIRMTPPEGIQIGETYIPGDVSVILPLYSIQRNPAAYAQPDAFVPERWTEKEDLIKKKGAFAPFSMGAMSCVGKGLAYMEIRAVLAMLLTQFDIDFAANEDGTKLIKNTEDHFTLNLGDLMLLCKPRN